MRLGLHIAYWGLGLDAAEQLRLVKEAERLDFASVWVGEAYGSDAATVLAWIAAQTERIEIGSGVFQMPARSAAMTAMTAATLDQLSGGRFRLGLGTSGPQVAEGWHGSRFDRPLTRTREYVEVVRMALARERVAYAGKTLTLPLPDGPGKALKLTIAPHQERIPISLAAIGPKNTTLAGEIADGWIPVLFSPEHVETTAGLLREGAERGGRSIDDVAITPLVYAAVMDDLVAARDAVRPMLALYVGGMGSRERNFYNTLVRSYGFGEAADRVQDLYLAGRKDEAMAALPDELIDSVCLCATPDTVGERLAAYADAGVDTLLINPIGETVDERLTQLTALARAGAGAVSGA
ncbi:luciferase family protein [Patulibacter medicamentivorans]|uniref:Luciferase family protein n=1 Tax=Patulibacter medicamentivorans TaxID=1097667 RepID=H0E5M8_9ACTN|nr:LLM class F420-dependent oxidoreductase [Patulibacter medicamentivorans]EHN10991.1 luciferase family protein [Patulibacter medicamentivorans]